MKKVVLIAIIGELNSGATQGVAEKVIAQAVALKNIGYDVSGYVGTWGKNTKVGFPEYVDTIPLGNISAKVKRKSIFLDEVLKKLKDVDILYFRYPLSDFSVLRFLTRFRIKFPNAKVILERQTKELPELLTRITASNLIKYLLESAFRVPVQSKIDLNVCVTTEIGDYVKGYYPTAACVTSGNGISQKLLTNARERSQAKNDLIRLVFVGNITPWCGIDWVISELKKTSFSHRGQSVILTVIGDGVFTDQLKQKMGNFESHVIFLGHQSGVALEVALLKNDLALGSFNNDARSLTEGSNLKLRLYCALGIPFVFREIDADFPPVGRVSRYYRGLNDQGIKPDDFLEYILDFAIKMKTETDAQVELSAYANDSLIWERKFERLRKTFHSVTGDYSSYSKGPDQKDDV